MYRKLEKWNSQKVSEQRLPFSKEEAQMAKKHIKKCPTILTIKEMQIKTTLRFHLIKSFKKQADMSFKVFQHMEYYHTN
jgi:hypothetical protein